MYEALGTVMLPSEKVRQKMLSTVQQKSRYKAVYDDTNNIGARLLAKQGWSVGQGLGKRMDGIQIPISHRVKMDNEGVGFIPAKDDPWTQHDVDFNDLLKRLNGEEDQNGADGSAVIDPKAQVQSLEERSKKSRARVHYKKFTRGKDLSQANEKDLASIFGKRSYAELNKPKDIVPDDPSTNESENDSQSEDRKSQILGLTTIKSSVSMHDYFKEKMKQKQSLAQQTATINDEPENVHGGDVEQVAEPKKKKNKKAIENGDTLGEHDGTVVKESVEAEELMEPRKKKKKSKKSKPDPVEPVTNGEEDAEHLGQNTPLEVNAGEETASDSAIIPKKSKRKHETVEVGSDVFDDPTETESMEPRKKKKKSKKNKPDPEQPAADGEQEPEQMNNEANHEQDGKEQESEPPKKKKKSKKNKAVNNESDDNATAEQSVSIAEDSKESDATQSNEAPTEKKKKSKKNKVPISDSELDAGLGAELAEAVQQEPEGKDAGEGNEPDTEYKPLLPIEGVEEEDVTCSVKVDILKHVDETAFPGSNFGNIVGYRLTEDVKLIKKDVPAYRMLDRHRFHMKAETVSDHRKWQKLKKVQAFTPV
uniref:Uncharacterized protein n=1 Tax=Anopheles atroparvus TaxID=41427 RepID=A0A182IZ57_ANOAO